MPGGGLTAVGLAGLVTSYSGLAHTFIDGMHALSGLLTMIGLIILAQGILDGGVSTTNRTKAVVLVIVSICLGFGTFALVFTENSTVSVFYAILIMITIPAVVISYFAMKVPQYASQLVLSSFWHLVLRLECMLHLDLLVQMDILLQVK